MSPLTSHPATVAPLLRLPFRENSGGAEGATGPPSKRF